MRAGPGWGWWRRAAALLGLPLVLALACRGPAVDAVADSGAVRFAADTMAPGLLYTHEDSTYAVSGATHAELRASMAARGPTGAGTPYFGSTLWSLRWRWRPERTSFGCRLADPVVRLETVMTLPAWDAPPEAPARLVARWAEFLAALHGHEQGHRDLAIAMAQETLLALDGVAAATCEQVGDAAQAAAARVQQRWDARQEAYEADLRNTPEAARWPER